MITVKETSINDTHAALLELFRQYNLKEKELIVKETQGRPIFLDEE